MPLVGSVTIVSPSGSPAVSGTSTATGLAASVTPAQSHALPEQSLLSFSLSTGGRTSSSSVTSPTELLEPSISEVVNDACEAALNIDGVTTTCPSSPFTAPTPLVHPNKPTPLKAQELFSETKDSAPSSLLPELVGVFSHFEVLYKSVDQYAQHVGFIAKNNSKVFNQTKFI